MQPLIVDSATALTEEARGRVVICGSHGGVYPAYLGARIGVGALVLNDAGIGAAQAGIAGLDYLANLGIPAAAVSAQTARIGDGADCATRGVISFANRPAEALGCARGQSVLQAAARLTNAPPHERFTPPVLEARSRIRGDWGDTIAVVAVDSASLVAPDDVGGIVVAGSHGGLLGGDPGSALRVDAFAALFNDATGGIDGAGFTRLPELDRRGIAAATVDGMRARIGDGRSTYEDGVLTRLNRTAERLGARSEMTARAFVDVMIKAKLRSIR
jgi:hypothetical protein